MQQKNLPSRVSAVINTHTGNTAISEYLTTSADKVKYAAALQIFLPCALQVFSHDICCFPLFWRSS